MEVEKRSSRGGFLQLFDWNVKSRKKLFSNKSDLPESSNKGKENFDNVAISRLQQMKLQENMHGPSLRGSDYASTLSNDEGYGTKAPGVVARLMGLDSLPTSDISEPSFTPFIDSHSFRHAHYSNITAELESEHHPMDYCMRNKLDGFSRNPVEDRLQKLQNRPIERFQTETLPPKSAKSIPITHHRLLSPIKSPGFMLTRNAAYIMEAASKIIEQSPQSNLNGRVPSFGSSSVPLRIRDLKEKMEAAQRISGFHEASQRTKENTSVKSSKSQPGDKRQSGSEIVPPKQGAVGSLKSKSKSVSLATQAKVNLQKGDGNTSRNTRGGMNQKEDVEVKLGHSDKKRRNTSVNNRSTTDRNPEVLRPNNQKQNCASTKDRSSSKPRVPYQQERKVGSSNGSSREIKSSKKASENSAVGTRKVNLVTAETGKEISSSKTKNFSGKKRPIDGNIILDGSAPHSVLGKEQERSVKCNITIDGSSSLDSVERKNGMDVVSFTFTSPIKKSVPESEPSAQSVVKGRSLYLDLQDDQSESKTSDLPTLRIPVIDSDALSVLLEQKLKELSSRVETHEPDLVQRGSPGSSASPTLDSVSSFNAANIFSAKHDKRFHLGLQKDKSISQHDSDVSSVDRLLVKPESKWQGVGTVGVMELSSGRSGTRVGGLLDHQHPRAVPVLELSLSEGSCITSDSTTVSSNGSKQCPSSELNEISSSVSVKNAGILEGEVELQDSASSIPNEGRKAMGSAFDCKFMVRSPNWKLDYIREVLSYAQLVLEDFGQTGKVLSINLFDQLENQKMGLDRNTQDFKLERKLLFDCVSMCLEVRCKRAMSGSCKEWAKLSKLFQRKDLLADELHREISGWTSMEDLMVDELVDKDMSTQDGRWLDFEAEGLEEGVVIENRILTSLIDELVTDLFFS